MCEPTGRGDAPISATAQRGRLAFAGPRARLGLRHLSADDLWLLVPPLILFVWLSLIKVSPPDFWWHLRLGKVIIESGAIAASDLSSFPRDGAGWINPQWLSQVILYLCYQVGGLPLILFLHRLAITGGYALVQWACVRECGVPPRYAALAMAVAVGLGSLNWAVRPQGLSFLFFGVLVYVLERHRARAGKIIWLLPLLFGAWVNLHGGFVFGLLLLAAYVAARVADDLLAAPRLRPGTLKALLAAAFSLLFLAASPHGPTAMFRYMLDMLSSNPVQALVQEWAPLSIRERDGLLFVAAIVLWFALIYRRRLKLATYHLAALLLLGLLSLYARRILPWFGMATAPALAIALTAQRSGAAQHRTAGKVFLNYWIATPLVVAALLSLPWIQPHLPRTGSPFTYLDSRWTPVQAGEVLCREARPARVFTDIAYGSYLLWACPSVSVFMDTRFERYSTETWFEYEVVVQARHGWQAVLDKYAVDTILADRVNQAALISAAVDSAGWEIRHQDEHTVLLTRVQG